ncbi:acyltransferase [Ceratobasidium sp. AG-Ba]|nr:acyltransferase [Ceratobasidium sp. AG-Ba]
MDIFLRAFVLKVFYGTIVVENEHFIPGNGEACNSLTDALVLVASISSKKRNLLRLTAKDTQFGRRTFQSWLIESAGTLPIKRRKDHAEGEANNTVVMEALVKALEEGDAICLFPEGMSRYHPSVAPLKTGVARIASDVLTRQKDNPDFKLTLLTCSITYMHRQHFRSDVLVSFNPPLRLTPKTHGSLINGPPNSSEVTQHAVRSLTGFLYDQITEGTITAPSWKVIRTAKAAARMYVPLGTGMGLGDWVRVPSLIRTSTAPGSSELSGVEWQPTPVNGSSTLPEHPENPSVSDEFVEILSKDIQLYQNHLERLGLKDFRVLQYSTLSRRRIIARILTRVPLAAALGVLALPGLVLWLPVFMTAAYFTKKHKRTGPVWDTYDEISQTKLIYGLAAGSVTWLICCLVTLPFAPITAFLVPVVMWMGLRWTEDLIASARAIIVLVKLLLIGKPEMEKTILWRENIHERVMQLAIQRLDLPANPEAFFSTQSSPGPRWDTKGGADKGRTQGLWARGTHYFSLRRRRKRDWNETMRWYDQTYLPEDES